MNLLDRLVSYVSPSAGMKRQQARIAVEQLRAYAGARDSRGRDGWVAHGTGANAEIGSSMVKMRNRVRQLVRDDSLAKHIVDLWTMHLVGDGITLDFQGSGAAKKNKIWLEWFESTQCDAEGILDGYGLQALACRIMVESGGVLIRKRYRRPSEYPHLAVPMQLQVLEPDYIDQSKSGTNPDNGNPIIQGIEFDKKNTSKRVAFWLFTEHPGESSINPRLNIQSIRIDADDCIYMFRKERNQVHGITWLHAVVTRIRDLDDYIEALMMKAKIEACFTIMVEDDDVSAPPGVSQKAASTQDFDIEPGLVRFLPKGKKAHAFDPSSSSGHSMLLQSFIRMIAIGVNLTYDQAYSDLTGANYSSLRAGKMEFLDTRSQYQWHIIEPGMVRPIAKWFVEAGYRAGHWSSDNFEIEVTMPKTTLVDPKKDGDAEIQEMENGLTTWSDRVKARGHNPRRQMERLKAEVEGFEKEGLEHPFSRRKSPEHQEAKAEKRKIKEVVARILEEIEDEAA